MNEDSCFFERGAETSIMRRAGVEAVGTLLLMLAIVGSGQMSARLASPPSGLGLLIAALATAGALVGLIVAFGAASGGHFNPLITLSQWWRGERKGACTFAYVVAQLFGASIGAVLASHAFEPVPWVVRSGLPATTLFASEFLSSAGLMLVVFGCSRSGRTEIGPFAVGAWLAAAIVAMPSLSYANPAVSLAALFATGPVGLQPATALLYGIAELLGAIVALPLVSFAYPVMTPPDRTGADARGGKRQAQS